MTETSPPMTPEEMEMNLTEFCGTPVVLQKEGATVIKCPYCGKPHVHPTWDTGHVEALCEEEDRNNRIIINGHNFIPNYGYTICEYKLVKEKDNVHCEFAGFPLRFPNNY